MRPAPKLPAWAAHASRTLRDEDVIKSSAAARIAAFLDGRTDGQDLLHELYDHVLDEPVPESMRALLRRN